LQGVPELGVNLLFRDLELEGGGSGVPGVQGRADLVPEEVGKVTAVCCAIRSALLHGGTPQEDSSTCGSGSGAGSGAGSGGAIVAASAAEELCVLTTYACSDPPLLEEALGRVRAARDWELKQQQRQNRQQLGTPSEGKQGRTGDKGRPEGSVAEAVGAVLSAAGAGVGGFGATGEGEGAGGSGRM